MSYLEIPSQAGNDNSIMHEFDTNELKKIVLPASDSHKGQNGKMMIIGGSRLFHAASLWALTTASRMVDMVFYSSVTENNALVHELKKEFRNGIIVPRDDIEGYIDEAESVLIGPGMMRTDKKNIKKENLSLSEINFLEDEGEQSYHLTQYLLQKYPQKKWIIDAGALQMMDLAWLQALEGNAVLTPHAGEFERVFGEQASVSEVAEKYHCIVLLKGEKDVICSSKECVEIAGGNAGMTKGGTGDVLAGLIAGLAANNDLFLSTKAGSFFNKRAGESLYERVGYFFNASDLADEIPKVMKEYLP